MGKRGKGEGSIEKLPSGKFRSIRSAGRDPVTDKQLKASRTFDKRSHAVDWLNDQRDQSNGTFASKPLYDWLDTWLEGKATSTQPATCAWYSQRVELSIRPKIGNVLLADLTAQDIRRMLTDMNADGRSEGERHKALKRIRNALNQAVDDQQIGRNVAKGITALATDPRESDCLTEAQVSQLLKGAQGTDIEPYVVLGLDTGCRPGELLGLHWPEVDIDAGAIRIRQSLEHIRGAMRLKAPKTKKGKRTIRIASHTIEAMRAYREARRSAGHDVLTGLVFTAAEGGFVHYGNFANRMFVPMMRDAGLPPWRPYTLRHTCATLLLLAGVNIKAVADRLGHKDPSVTLKHYAHVLDSMVDRAVSVVQEFLTGSGTANPTGTPRPAP